MATLTKKLRAGLVLLAGVMPAATYTAREVVTGHQLLADSVTTLPNGTLVDGLSLYKRPVQLPLNHERRLCRAFEQQGRAGVLAYCKQYIQPEHFEAFSAKLSELVPAS